MESSTEFRLLVECCGRAFRTGDDASFETLSATVHWEPFARLVRFHRVQGLVWSSLRSAGAELQPEISRSLSADAREIAATNLRIAAEAGELRPAFDEAGLRILFVKGVTVGALAYSRPMLKMGWDIDVLVDEADVLKAAAELSARGYARTIPRPGVDLATWHGSRKESVWSRPDQRLHVELHTRLADNRRLIPGIGMDSPRREVEVTRGTSLPTLAADELFAYLCVHGASSAWFRLKWITDLAALLHRAEPAEIERLYQRSQQLGAARAADQALLLAHRLYGSLEGTSLMPRLSEKRSSRWLAAMAYRQVRQSTEPTSTPLGTWRIHLSQLLLRPGLSFQLSELSRQIHDLA